MTANKDERQIGKSFNQRVCRYTVILNSANVSGFDC